MKWQKLATLQSKWRGVLKINENAALETVAFTLYMYQNNTRWKKLANTKSPHGNGDSINHDQKIASTRSILDVNLLSKSLMKYVWRVLLI